jgi:hypothetical protein
VSILVLPHMSCISLALDLLQGEQKFKLGGCLGAHKTLISYTNISSKCMILVSIRFQEHRCQIGAFQDITRTFGIPPKRVSL